MCDRNYEIAVSRIPGAVTAAEFESNLEQYQDAVAIAYCTIGHRSGLYAQKLQQQGINVFNLEGSLLAWTHAGGELVNAEGTTRYMFSVVNGGSRLKITNPSGN